MMKMSQDDAKLIRQAIWPDEQILGTTRQREFGPGGSVLERSCIVATNKRLIIINRQKLGLKRELEMIEYSSIVGMKLERGIFSSTIYFRMLGSTQEDEAEPRDGSIEGLHHQDAEDIMKIINMQIKEFSDRKARADKR